MYFIAANKQKRNFNFSVKKKKVHVCAYICIYFFYLISRCKFSFFYIYSFTVSYILPFLIYYRFLYITLRHKRVRIKLEQCVEIIFHDFIHEEISLIRTKILCPVENMTNSCFENHFEWGRGDEFHRRNQYHNDIAGIYFDLNNKFCTKRHGNLPEIW